MNGKNSVNKVLTVRGHRVITSNSEEEDGRYFSSWAEDYEIVSPRDPYPAPALSSSESSDEEDNRGSEQVNLRPGWRKRPGTWTIGCTSKKPKEIPEATSAGSNENQEPATEEPPPGINCLGPGHRKAYARGRAHNMVKGVKRSIRVMIDNGNLVSQGVAVSSKFMEKMGLGYSSLGRGRVPTAGSGAMTNMGISEPFSLKLDGISKTFTVKALVCKELSDEVNIGTGFFQKISVPFSETSGKVPCLRFYRDGTTLSVNDESIPLIKSIHMAQGKPGMTPEEGSSMEPERDGKAKTAGDNALEWTCDPVTGSPYISSDSYWTEQDVEDGEFDRFGLVFYTGISLAESRRKRARSNERKAKQEEARRKACPMPEEAAAKDKRTRQQTRDDSRRQRPTSVGSRVSRGGYPLHSKEACTLKANSLNFVKTMRLPLTSLVEPVKRIPGAPYARAMPAVYRKQNKIAILNLGNKDVLIPKGTEIGVATPMKPGQRSSTDTSDPAEGVHTLGEEDVQKLYKELRLDENEILKRDPQLMADTKALVREFADIFASPERAIGKTDLIEMVIKLVPDAKPKKAACRPLNPDQRADLKKQLQLWIDEDIAEESESPWASAMVPVKKKGGATRWAVDYRTLNAVTIKDAYPLPNIQENLDRMQGSKIFSTLDAAGAYHTVPVAEKSRPLLAFTTPFGLFHFKRMPFGPANSGQVYSRFMQMLVDKLRSPYVVCYVDDVILATPDIQTHMKELRNLFQMHRDAGICVTAKKTFLLQSEADYLGYRVSADGIHMKQDMVQKVLDWPTPKTIKELSSFLGFASYYRSFIPQFATLTAEMSSQKRKKTLDWTEIMEAKFKELKLHFSRKPIRAYPDYSDEAESFEVWPDFSSLALGGVLQQVQGGQRRLIAAGGRKTSKGEANYAPTKGELAGIVQMLRKFEHILRYRRFKIFTDHSPLKWLRSMKNPRGIIFRWLQELESYDFTVEHVAGKLTGAADGLSRSSHLRDPTPEEVAESEEYIMRVSAIDDPRPGLEDLQLNRTKLREQQEQDEVLQRVKKWVKGNPPKSKEELRGLPEDCKVYHQHLGVLDVDEGDLLVMKGISRFEGDRPTPRLLVPETSKLRGEVFKWSHCHQTAGHFGMNATCLRASNRFYWPGMNSALRHEVKRCQHCLAKQTQVKQRDTVHKPRRHGFPGEVLYVDLVGPLPRSDKGNAYVCTMQDGFTKYVTAMPIPNKEASTTAHAILEGYICKFGCPNRIHTDQGTEFKNALWADLCDRLQVEKTETPAYNPHSNLVERFHRSLNQIFRIHMNREDKSWERFLSMACLAYNTKINASTGISPFEAWMGRKAKLPIDLVVPLPDRLYQSEDDFVRDTQQRFSSMYAFMRRNAETAFARNAKLYTGTTHGYKVGDLVWLFSKRKVDGKPLKLTDAWLGPYRVLSTPAEVLLEVTPAETAGRRFTTHVSRVRPFTGGARDQKYRPPKEPVVEDPDDLAEEIGQPDEFVEPLDNLLIPIAIDREPPNILDIVRPQQPQPRPDPAPAAPAAPAAPDTPEPLPPAPAVPQPGPSGTNDGARRKTRQSAADRTSGHKRDREDTQPGPLDPGKRTKKGQTKRPAPTPDTRQPAKQGKSQGTKRDRDDETPVWARSTRRHWQEYARPDTEDTMESDLTDGEVGAVHPLVPPALVVEVPPGADVPERMTTGSAGHDCRANQSVTLQPGKTTKVSLGLRAAIPDGWCMLLLSRSKLATEGITVEGGLIDSDYRGPILCVLHNHTNLARRITKGERICQALFLQTPHITWQVNEAWQDPPRLDPSGQWTSPPRSGDHASQPQHPSRGESGFGSTGN